MNRRILYQEASRSHQQRIKKSITDTLSTIQNEILEPHGLKFKRIEIDANAQNRIDNFKCEILLNHVDTIPSIPIRRVIFIKDKHNISDVTYKNLRSKLKLQLPSLVELKSERRLYDQMINIKQNSKGVYLNIVQKLKFLIPKIKANIIDQSSNILHIKFSADGAQIVKQKSFLNFTFTIMNEGKIAETANGNYTCGIYDISKEDYETLVVCFAEIQLEIDNLNDIDIDGIEYKFEKYIAGDLKMLANIYGIKHANANCPCIWCVWDKRKLVNIDIKVVEEEIKREWSIVDKAKGARSIEDSISSTGLNGYAAAPIFKIPFHRIVVDVLHLFLRITDVFYELFISDLKKLDGKQNNQVDLSTQPHLRQFFTDLTTNYQIRRPFYVNGKELKLRDLLGPEKKIVL